jgi:hypothetical protein
MGLDTYASRSPRRIALTDEDREILGALELPLVEWDGDGGFRGKVYDELVGEITNISLYNEWILPEEVAEMAASFEVCNPEEVARSTKDYRFPSTADEIRALQRLFRICANRGIGFVGWW